MAILKFKMTDVRKLIAEIEASKTYKPTIDDLFNPEMHQNGVVLDKHGLTEKAAAKKGTPWWPSADNIDASKLVPVLQCVGDSGVYLITNVAAEGTPAERGTVAYADGCNPNIDEDYYDSKRRLFGSDDGSVTIPYQWVLWAQSAKKRLLKLKLNSDSVELIQR